MPCEFKPSVKVPVDLYPKPYEFVNEALSIVKGAEERGVVMRIMGGLAIYLLIRGTEYERVWNALGRLGECVFTDIDLATYGKDGGKIINYLLTEERIPFYLLWQPSLMYYGTQRLIFYGCPEAYMRGEAKVGKIPMVEVFLDALRMNHTISFKGRLKLNEVTLTPADLLLKKLQIVRINEKDIKDAIILLLAVDLSNTDTKAINADYIAKLLSDDWGFYCTFTTNLTKIKEYLKARHLSALTDKYLNVISNKIDKLRKIIEEHPKASPWKIRTKVGTKKKWYDDVEELLR